MRWLRPAAVLLSVAACALYVALGIRSPWDFETYYFAARAVREGLDPYQLASLSGVAGKAVELPFLYPPATLLLFLPISLLPLQAAVYLWLAVQCLLALLLLRLWRRYFLPDAPPDLLLVAALLGFNAALLWALRTGNLALLEAALLWAGFGAFARGRMRPAAVLITLGGAFKILPLAFLALIAAGPGGRRDRASALVGAGLVLAGILAASWSLIPEWAAAVERSIPGERPAGEVNPGLLGLLDGWTSGGGRPAGALAPAVYAAFCAAVLALSVRPLAKLRREGSRAGWIMLGVLAWLLVAPRVMVYSWVMAVPPAIFVIRRWIGPAALWSVAYGCILLQGVVRFLPGPPPRALDGLSFFLLLGLWGIALWGVSRDRPIGAPAPTTRSRFPQ